MVEHEIKLIGAKLNNDHRQATFIALNIFCDNCGSSNLYSAYKMDSKEGCFYYCDGCGEEFFVREIIIKKERVKK